MRLRNLQIQDFRGIRDLKIDFHDELTVIVGRNGVGKTTILDVLAKMLWSLRHLWPNDRGEYIFGYPSFLPEDIRYGAEEFFFEFGIEFESLNTVQGADHMETVTYSFSKQGLRQARTLEQLFNRAENGDFLPGKKSLFVYYHQERGFKNKSKSQNVFNSNILHDTSLNKDLKAISDLEVWWDKRDSQEARQVRDSDPSYRDPQLEAIRQLVGKVDSFSDITFLSTSSQPGLFLTKDDGSRVRVDKLSSGEQSYIILLADLARRLQVFVASRPLNEIPGIVLIDEIELNLHPAWQSEIVSTLLGIFKKCQFVITTHSAQVLSSVSSKNIRVLDVMPDGESRVKTPLSTKGQTSNYLLEGVFGTSERFPPVDRLIDQFNHAIDNEEAGKARRILDEILGEVEGEPPDLIVLKKRLRKLEGTT